MDACRLLEIGIQNGGSLALWAKYFPNAKHIVGCDVDPACKALAYDDARIRIVSADANSPEALNQIDSISDAFDIVIDDGSHVPRDVIASFLNYFPRLSPGGLYVAEDLHCDYLASHDGGILEPYTATNFFVCLVKLMSRTYWRDQLPPKDFAKPVLWRWCAAAVREGRLDRIDHISRFVGGGPTRVDPWRIPTGKQGNRRRYRDRVPGYPPDPPGPGTEGSLTRSIASNDARSIERAGRSRSAQRSVQGLAERGRGDGRIGMSEGNRARSATTRGRGRCSGAFCGTRDPDAAETALRRAVELDPRFPDAHFQTGNLHRLRGDFERRDRMPIDALWRWRLRTRA